MSDNSLQNFNVYPTGFQLLQPMVHHYPWGVIGSNSLVYRLYSLFMDNNSLSHSTEHFAELWLGTHVRGPSTVISPQGNEPLSAHLKRLQLSSPREEKDSEYLGFLLKVLAIDLPLSIQAHPDAFMSSQLLATGHLSVVDTTAKAEFTIALTDFEALYSLKSLQEIISLAQMVQEFGELIKSSGFGHILETCDFSNEDNNYKSILNIVQCILSLDNSGDEILARMTARLENSEKTGITLKPIEQLLLRLHKSFPNDMGIWFGLVMNYVKLKPGEALFTPPNILHSYLSGTCIECMASSDNVIRAGLTKKHTDNITIIECIRRTINDTNIHYINPIILDDKGYSVLYGVIHETCNFSVTRICLPPGGQVVYTNSQEKCAIAITVSSNPRVEISTILSDNINNLSNVSCETNIVPKLGTALLIYPGTSIKINNGVVGNPPQLDSFIPTESSDWFVMFIAHSNIN